MIAWWLCYYYSSLKMGPNALQQVQKDLVHLSSDPPVPVYSIPTDPQVGGGVRRVCREGTVKAGGHASAVQHSPPTGQRNTASTTYSSRTNKTNKASPTAPTH
jgi:hypothetical protein